ncbi:MAG TPA: FAD:protein FMN transferase [Pirellulales bacterium]|jgi:thiamine biosynthesis lipoprotein|nr:FAD:protein FMN transferase [Pirellulales bacterium]
MKRPHAKNRRDFLSGRAPAAENEPPSAAAEEPRSRAAEPYLVQYKRRAMACDFELYLNAGQYPDGGEVALAALDLIEQLEQQLSIYRSSSEVSEVNRLAGQQSVRLEPRLFALLAQAAEIFRATEGAYDITAGPLVKAWGFYRRQGAIPQPEALALALACIGSQNLLLDEAAGTISFQKPGMELNLGSIGKGYALDRAGELLATWGISDYLWHGGQSSVLARGIAADNGPRGWTIGVRDPVRSDRRLAEISLRDRALSTSGSGVQFFRHRGKRYGHILDPRTGWPAEGVFSATVVAPTAAEADALSTAFYVMGVEAALAYCQAHSGIGTLLVYPSRRQSKVELAVGGLDDSDWRRLAGE